MVDPSASASAGSASAVSVSTTVATADPSVSNHFPLELDIPIPEWLVSEDLPSIDRLQRLIEIYVTQVHSVRCMGFVYVPSLMERVEEPSMKESGLVHAMCALAAPFYYAQLVGFWDSIIDLPTRMRFFEAGKGWASAAMSMVFSSFGRPPGIEGLMTEILLHEHYLRVGDYARAFLISGLVSRHMQVLQLNIEYDYDLLGPSEVSWAVKESRRRVTWMCYLLDAFIECGIDQLRFVSPEDVQIQLPCDEALFVRSMPSVTEMLPRGKLLPFVDPSLRDEAARNLDMRAFYIRATAIRSKILKYVKHLEGEVPWALDGECRFSELSRELIDLENSIPENMRMVPMNTYFYRSTGRLNLYFGLHILVSQTFNDLYRIGVSKLVFPDSATRWIRENAPDSFIRQCHCNCIARAVHIASILHELWVVDKPSLIDSAYVLHAPVCSSVLVTSLVSWPHRDPPIPELPYSYYRELLESNVQILQYLQRFIKSDAYAESAHKALKHFDRMFTSNDHNDNSRSIGDRHAAASPAPTAAAASEKASRAPVPPQYSLEYILSPLGTYPFARQQVNDRHQPETRQANEVKRRQTNTSVNSSMRRAATMAAATMADQGVPVTAAESSLALAPPPPPQPPPPQWNVSEFSTGPVLDWVAEMSAMDGMGYPTFLDEFLGY